ncbi:mycothiol synthase [uncultured Pseudokineococcus sp.]|uniref:mycothiol synthase n=1 Tax=uncultured Pseudokineococcus sp. TaxID=1642928 RepID=UPI00262627EB|nr:mycothiol synthase [uncultured Pseudokineococcus sp.]
MSDSPPVPPRDAPPREAPDGVHLVPALAPGEVDAVLALVAAAARADGTPPVSEQGLLQLRAGEPHLQHLLARRDGRLVGYGLLVPEPGGEGAGSAGALVGELVVDPAARGRGTGRALLEAALAARGERALRLWMHGDLPAAAALARGAGLTRVRELLTMEADLSAPLPPLPEVDGVRLRSFEPGRDEEAWLAVNARAFADHPEQGAWTLEDVRAREAEPWFDAAGLLLAEDERTGALLGSHWTKTTPAEDGPEDEAGDGTAAPVGEVYVVGVDPSAQGRGVGRLVTLAGLHHLRDRGVRRVELYVEADNAAALAVYRRLGFERSGADVVVEAPATAATGGRP